MFAKFEYIHHIHNLLIQFSSAIVGWDAVVIQRRDLELFIRIFPYLIFFFRKMLQSSIRIQINVPELIPIFLGPATVSTKSSLCCNSLDVVLAVIYGASTLPYSPTLECLAFNMYRFFHQQHLISSRYKL